MYNGIQHDTSSDDKVSENSIKVVSELSIGKTICRRIVKLSIEKLTTETYYHSIFYNTIGAHREILR